MKNKNIKYVFEHFVTTMITIVIFCLSLSVFSYTPESQQNQGTLYWKFGDLFFLYLIYAAPVYLIGGFPYSLFLEKFLERFKTKGVFTYLLFFVSYSIGGAILAIVFSLILIGQSSEPVRFLDVLGFSLFGIAASLLFFHVLLIIKFLFGFFERKLFKRLKNI